MRVISRRARNERQEKRQNSVSVSSNRSGSKQTSEQPKRKPSLSARERRLSMAGLRPPHGSRSSLRALLASRND